MVTSMFSLVLFLIWACAAAALLFVLLFLLNVLYGFFRALYQLIAGDIKK